MNTKKVQVIKMKNILFFTYYARHLKKLLPLIKVMQNDARLRVSVVLMTEEEKRVAEENNIAYSMLDQFTDSPRNYDFDLGWGLEPLIKAIDTVSPDLFIAIEVNYILRNAVRYCKQKKIHNVIIQHGLINKYSLQAFLPFEGEYFLAWGEYTKDYLVENFVDEKKIVLTGGINFDETLKITPDKAKIAAYLGVDPDKKWIVFTTQQKGTGDCPSEEEIHLGITESAKAAMRYKDYQLIFQVHPSQSIDDVLKKLDNVTENTAVAGRYKNTEELIAASDGLITFFSTTAVDALILNKPIMLINMSEDRDFLPFVKQKAAVGAYVKEDISKCFDDLVRQSRGTSIKENDIIDSINFKNDGMALSRVLDKCYQIIGLEVEDTYAGEQ
jgi:hypothetical protein